MDAITQKYSVFDFFNLLIAGIVFLSTMVICHYPNSIIFLKTISTNIDDSIFLTVISIITYVGCALVLGMILQVVGHWLIKEKLGWQTKVITECLTGSGIFDNSYRTKRLLLKAMDYLGTKESVINKDEILTFFAHCIYYLHVNHKDEKTEKLRETQGLSELFACVFWSVPAFSLIICIFQIVILQNMDINFVCLLTTYVVSILLGVIFYYRYKISCHNRIRMVLSIYDECTNQFIP